MKFCTNCQGFQGSQADDNNKCSKCNQITLIDPIGEEWDTRLKESKEFLKGHLELEFARRVDVNSANWVRIQELELELKLKNQLIEKFSVWLNDDHERLVETLKREQQKASETAILSQKLNDLEKSQQTIVRELKEVNSQNEEQSRVIIALEGGLAGSNLKTKKKLKEAEIKVQKAESFGLTEWDDLENQTQRETLVGLLTRPKQSEVDEINKTKQELANSLTEKSKELEELEKAAEIYYQNSQKEINQLENDYQQLEQNKDREIKDLQNKEKEIAKKLAISEKDFQTENQVKEQIANELLVENSQLKKVRYSLTQQKTHENILIKLVEQEMATKEEDLRRTCQERDSLQEKLEATQKENDELKRQQAEVNIANLQFKEAQEKYKSKYEKVDKELKQKNEMIQVLQTSIEQLVESQQKTADLEQELNKDKERKSGFFSEVQQLEKRSVALQEKNENFQNQLKQENEENQKLNGRINSLNEKVEVLEKEVADLEQKKVLAEQSFLELETITETYYQTSQQELKQEKLIRQQTQEKFDQSLVGMQEDLQKQLTLNERLSQASQALQMEIQGLNLLLTEKVHQLKKARENIIQNQEELATSKQNVVNLKEEKKELEKGLVEQEWKVKLLEEEMARLKELQELEDFKVNTNVNERIRTLEEISRKLREETNKLKEAKLVSLQTSRSMNAREIHKIIKQTEKAIFCFSELEKFANNQQETRQQVSEKKTELKKVLNELSKKVKDKWWESVNKGYNEKITEEELKKLLEAQEKISKFKFTNRHEWSFHHYEGKKGIIKELVKNTSIEERELKNFCQLQEELTKLERKIKNINFLVSRANNIIDRLELVTGNERNLQSIHEQARILQSPNSNR